MIEPIAIKVAGDIVSSYIKRRIDAPSPPEDDLTATIGLHLREALTWSQRIQFFGMSSAEETDAATIPLRLNLEPRRFRNPLRQINRNETDLLSDGKNYLLLGDPGAGKTTTLKRLVQSLLLESPSSDADQYAFPIVLRLRELSGRETVAEAIAAAIGLPFERRAEADRVTLLSGTRRLQDVIIEFMNSNKVVLILDGLDEVPGEPRRLYGELGRLGLNVNGSKILLSCRSGDYARVIDGFDVLEICPLDPAETMAIAKAWLGEPGPFLADLQRLPYRDMADRPLLLTQLLYIYQRYGYLPEQPSQIYRRVISLLLQEWDAERGISRLSSYAQFDPDRKAAFLAAIAYYLTYKVKAKQFTTRDLESAYLRVRDRFRLPREQAAQVIQEIETHTGIIAAAGNGLFEFTHLSVQEFLCADYLSREPHSEHLNDYMMSYPAPVAITVALSSNPSITFAALMLKPSRSAPASASFLSRLLLERPFFDVSASLGIAVMRLYRDAGAVRDMRDLLDDMLTFPAVLESISRGLAYYHVTRGTDPLPAGFVRLERVSRARDTGPTDESVPRREAVPFKLPTVVTLPRRVLKQLAATGDHRAGELYRRADELFRDADA